MPDQRLARLGGVLLPVTTPFDQITGEIAPVSFRENLRRWLEHPVDGFVLFGSTGEGALLGMEEKLRLFGFARDLVPPAMHLIAGAGADSTRYAATQCRQLADAGAEAILLHPPIYFATALSSADIRDHYLAVADASPVPLIVYHMPRYTQVTMEPGLIAELARHPNVAGLKDSSGDVKRLAEYANACGDECRLLVGNGALFYTALELGAHGGILALALLAPADCAEICQRYQAGESAAAGSVQERIAPVHKGVIGRYGPPGIKAALDVLGYAGGPPRPPLRPLPGKSRDHVARVMHGSGLR